MRSSGLMSNDRGAAVFALTALLGAICVTTAPAYEDYSGCKSCHGDFRGATSTKGTVFPGGKNHDMHRSADSMATACNLCHIGASRLPVNIGSSTGTADNAGLGCTGCHMGVGLRAHHAVNGVSECDDCHADGPPPAEDVKPPYYGTVDTKVDNPGNTVLAANVNENWSVGDFLGLDNDGNNLYDLADYAIGPFRILSLSLEGSDVRVTWLTAGGRTDRVQAAGSALGAYVDVSPPLNIPGLGEATHSFLDVGGAADAIRFYRIGGTLP